MPLIRRLSTQDIRFGVLGRWMSDALSVYEVTAALIFDRILDPSRKRPFDRLVIIGNSPLALAACAELAQREREGDSLSAPPHPGLADLILYGPQAEALRKQHRLRQERFGNSVDIGLTQSSSPSRPRRDCAPRYDRINTRSDPGDDPPRANHVQPPTLPR